MKTIGQALSRLVLCTSFLTVVLYPADSPAATCQQWVAKVMSVEGRVDVRRVGETQWQPAKLNDTYCAGDVIRVQERSRADIVLVNQPVLRLDQNTTITLGGVKEDGGSLIDLVQGAAHFFSRLPRNLEIRTAFVNAGVEGTEGLVRVETDKALITIFEGKVLASNESGSLRLTDGQSAEAEKGKAPTYRTVVRPRDAVQWALYYPPVMDLRAEAMPKEDLNDPRFLANRAALSLSVGRVDEANADIARALKLNPNSSDALAVQSVIAVVQNDKDKARDLSRQAVAADPKSSSALIAQSYAQQAQFDLKGARKSAEEAVQVNPNDALAWARLAELQLSFGELNKALEAAQKAVALNPNLSRTQTVLGYAYLLRVDTKQAKEAFTKAIELDQADSLPRLGLGLAKFREGHVEEGRKDMEIAASLDPNNAIVRSYLGKAYFEEKRDQLTEREYATAKELDPKDPTPYFYDALQKQLTNRPVEALQDMEKAIELNKNRAVYRSQLQIDSDLAARSASLGRIYTDLGFQQVALVEGWTSINTDPTSFTAARFLADSYAALPRHEIARVSELLRSQLLQPINITPIQPSLAESNLFLISSLGPTATSFNEFNTLMVNRDRLTYQGTGLVGNNGTASGENIISGIFKKASFSAGYNNFRTDGFRTNAQQDDKIGNVFVQLELTPQTSIQGEWRYRSTDRGDTALRFFPDNFQSGLTSSEKSNTYRFGLRHNFTPNSIVLGSFMYREVDFEDNFVGSRPPVNSINVTQPRHGFSGEAQHLFRSQYVTTEIGAGHFNIEGVDRTTLDLQAFCAIPVPFPPFCLLNIPATKIVTEPGADTRHTDVYGYSHIKPLDNVTFTLGVSTDFVDSDDPSGGNTNQVNPKFGMIWEPFPGTTIRAAAFRALKRTLITNQTIEPTQVAGFNQFFDDINSTDAWRFGGALNQKFTNSLYAGGEYSYRELKTPFTDFTNPDAPVARRENQNEYQARAYLFWAPHAWLALRAEYLWELFKTAALTDQPRTMTTHRVPLGISAFHPSGLSASLTATYWNQDGTFQQLNSSFASGSDNFWIFDAFVGFRLPKRYGLLSVGVMNLFDKEFKFFDRDFRNPLIQPDRMVFARLTLALP